MAPSATTEDYYMILGVERTAGLELIVKSYKRLALKLHPDRNAKRDATEAFQKLQRAYETLRDESERRKYDLLHPHFKGKAESSQYTQKPRTQSETLSETAEIAALEKSKQERAAQWRTKNNISESLIFETKRAIRRLEQEIKGLDSIVAAEAAAEARKNSWGTWVLSPMYQGADESLEEKDLKERARQERRIEKDMKERRLDNEKKKLKAAEFSMSTAKVEKEAADSKDDMKIRILQYRIQMRENRQRRESEQLEKERAAKQRKQQQEEQEKRQREAAEILRQQQAARRKAEQEKREADIKRWQKIAEEVAARRRAEQEEHQADIKRQQKMAKDERERQRVRTAYSVFFGESTSQTRRASCRHDGWWPKVQGRTACPECSEFWTYLLECPGCDMKACPKCQAAVRPRRQRAPPRVRTPSPDFWGH
ncbi:DnaJ-domain-containing protein [Phaeosphaeriaceae sp. SRC1lsM3a]|nr:DnaJ-domain-containing protein [Stagonospora sp. SRC1lsM3a]